MIIMAGACVVLTCLLQVGSGNGQRQREREREAGGQLQLAMALNPTSDRAREMRAPRLDYRRSRRRRCRRAVGERG